MKLKISTFNLHNLFLAPPIAEGEVYKPDHKARKLADRIRQLNADIIMVQEVGGESSLARFCRDFLRDEYTFAFLPGNSKRGIEVAYLIKKRNDYSTDILTHRDHPIKGMNNTLFSRDVSELRISVEGILQLILLNLHLKSKRTTHPSDPDATLQRRMELMTAIEISDALGRAHDVPIILGGDFNCEDPKILAEQSSLDHHQDILDILQSEHRWTHVYFDKAKDRHLVQFDYLFLDRKWHSLIIKEESGRFFDDHSCEMPHRPYQLYQMASDHYPIYLTLEL